VSDTQEEKAKGKKAKHAAEGNGAEAAKDKAPRDRTSKNFNKEATITLLVEKNPKRENTKCHGRFALYASSATVGDFITLGGTYGDLSWDSARGFISISGYTPKMVEKKAKAEKAVKGQTEGEAAAA